MGFLSRFFDSNAREIERYRRLVDKINAFESKLEPLSNDELRARTEELKAKVQEEYRTKREAVEDSWAGLTDQKRREEDRKVYDPILDAVLPEAFALVREASKRTIGLRHYDVQMIGGMVLHDGRIPEMRTGEGKTLVATCPIFLNALLGKGAHLVTVNDYLSKRDAVWNGPIYHLLGMSVGIIQGQSPETGDEGGSFIYDPDYADEDPRFHNARRCTRAEAYACDITYGTNNEFGFDYLRDNMAFSKDELVQGDLHYAIVDEVDSILIDEARTPLIISGMVEQSTDLYDVADRIVAKMQRGIDDPKNDKDNPNADKLNKGIHYVVDEKAKTATITDGGVDFAEAELARIGYVKRLIEEGRWSEEKEFNLSEDNQIMHHLSAAMKAHGVFHKDVEYVVLDTDPNDDKGPEIVIVDENTGRLMFGRRYSDGLHQAIEAKEHVEVQHESQTLATITFQNYFRLYSKLGGMTGTAKTEEEEFRKIYALDVLQVPTNKPVQRADHADVIYKRVEHKLRGITAEILRVYCKEQPILVGTRSIETSERVSKRLSPQALKLLCLVEVARHHMENSKALSGDQKRQYTALLNMPMEAWAELDEQKKRTVHPPLAIGTIRPLLKELGLSEDPLTPDNMNLVAKLFEIKDDWLERLEEALTHGIAHNILNAKFHEKEAVIIAEAGRKGAVTIATNMAGRGVDILLGGRHINQELPTTDGKARSLDAVVKSIEEADRAEEAENAESGEEGENLDFRRFGNPVLNAASYGELNDADHKRAAEEVRKLGGLYILGTERHESRRIDNQLRGRSGRQGDPGESRFFVSMEDELMRLFGEKANSAMLRTWDDHLGMDTKILSLMIQRAQKKVEEHYFEARKNVLNYDDVMNRQRELIYRERRQILQGADLRDTILEYMEQTVQSAAATYCRNDQPQNEWEIEDLYRELNDYFLLYPVVEENDLRGKSREEIVDFLTDHVMKVYQSKVEEIEGIQGEGAMHELERWMALRAVNNRWMEHLANMDYLREGIGLRGYEQKDPLMIYQKEAFAAFEEMQALIKDDIVRNMCRIQFADAAAPPPSAIIQLPPNAFDADDEMTALPTIDARAAAAPQPRKRETPPADWKGGRNDPCWCGSGQKYKKCHGK